MANTTNDVPFFERYERLLNEGNDLGSLLDTFYVENIARSIRRARFSYGSILGVDVRQSMNINDPQAVIVNITTGCKWIGLFLKHEDGFVTCSSGGLFFVNPDSTIDPSVGLGFGNPEHGPLTDDCQVGLMELGLGVETTRLFTPA